MLISGRYYPYVFSDLRFIPWSPMRTLPEQVSKDPSQKPDVDLVVVRENTECLVCLHVLQPSATASHVGCH